MISTNIKYDLIMGKNILLSNNNCMVCKYYSPKFKAIDIFKSYDDIISIDCCGLIQIESYSTIAWKHKQGNINYGLEFNFLALEERTMVNQFIDWLWSNDFFHSLKKFYKLKSFI